jgi:hypothetical protein
MSQEPLEESIPLRVITAPQQWEYKTERFSSQDGLNDLGDKNWELVGLITHNYETSEYLMVFKRPKKTWTTIG